MQFSSQLNMKHYSVASRVSSSAVTLPAVHPAVQLSNIFSAASNPKAISLSYHFYKRPKNLIFLKHVRESAYAVTLFRIVSNRNQLVLIIFQK